jgi:beta-lactam-binding protein with PASTA domain
MESFDKPHSICPSCGHVEGSQAKDPFCLTPGTELRSQYIAGNAIKSNEYSISYIGFDKAAQRKVEIEEYYPKNLCARMPGEATLTPLPGKRQDQYRAGLKGFTDEGKILESFKNPSISETYETFQENGTAYTVKEHVEGITFAEMMAEGIFQYEPAKAIMLKILHALDDAHKRGITNANVSPDNIYLSKTGQLKLAGFGKAKFELSQDQIGNSAMATPGFTPEEQYRTSGRLGPWSDVYAAGAVFYKALTGKAPGESLARLMEDDLKPPSALGASLPQSAENAIMNALNVHVDSRTQSAHEFIKQLESTETKREKEKAPVLPFPLWMRVAGAAACIIVIGSIAIYTNSGVNVTGVTSGALAYQVPDGSSYVPNVKNKTLSEAETLLKDQNLVLVIDGESYSERIPLDKYRIVKQNPKSGAIAAHGSDVAVTITAGNEAVKAIDVSRTSQEDAIKSLGKIGLKAEVVEAYSDEVPVGEVISQDVSGVDVLKGDIIKILVSKGPEEITIPSLIGLDAEEARAILEEARLVFIEVTSRTSEYPVGAIISQEPAEGGKVRAGTVVSLTVNEGIRFVEVPNLLGRNEQDAREAALVADLNVEISREASSTIPMGSVIRQSIAAGQTVAEYSTLRIVVSTGPSESIAVARTAAPAATSRPAARTAQPSTQPPRSQTPEPRTESPSTPEPEEESRTEEPTEAPPLRPNVGPASQEPTTLPPLRPNLNPTSSGSTTAPTARPTANITLTPRPPQQPTQGSSTTVPPTNTASPTNTAPPSQQPTSTPYTPSTPLPTDENTSGSSLYAG